MSSQGVTCVDAAQREYSRSEFDQLFLPPAPDRWLWVGASLALPLGFTLDQRAGAGLPTATGSGCGRQGILSWGCGCM